MSVLPGRDKVPVSRGVIAGEPVPRAIIPPVPPVIEVEFGALALQSVHARFGIDQKLQQETLVKFLSSTNLSTHLFTFVRL